MTRAKVLKVLLLTAASLCGTVLLVLGHAYYVIYRHYEVPVPPIARKNTKEAHARGEKIFVSVCQRCHVEGGNARMLDGELRVLGKLMVPSINPDSVAAWSDGELARAIRYGVLKGGERAIGMPRFELMGDDDVASLITYMRSGREYFAPDPQVRPRPALTPASAMMLVWGVGIDKEAPRGVIPVPPKGPTVEYGEYMTNAVYQCWDCHTEGLGRDRYSGPNAFGGGVEFRDDQSRALYSANLTFYEGGMGKWSLHDFTRTVRDGIGPDGFIVQPPMQRYRFIDNEEMEAIFKYLQTVPKVKRPNKAGTTPLAKPAAEASPAELYAQLGCRLCHGWKAPFDARVREASTKPVSAVASWIRNPQQFKPGSQMPTFADLVDESQALALAEWLRKSSRVSQSAGQAGSAPGE